MLNFFQKVNKIFSQERKGGKEEKRKRGLEGGKEEREGESQKVEGVEIEKSRL